MFLVLFLFLGLGVQSYAATAIEEVDIARDGEELENTNLAIDLFLPLENDEPDSMIPAQDRDELFACWIVTLECCCANVETQYCDDGLHGTMMEWYDEICGQKCPGECDL